MRAILISSFLAAILSGCEGEVSPSDAFLIDEEDVPALIAKAENGELNAINQLISHYSAGPDEEQVRRWRARAIELGDPTQLRVVARQQLSQAMHEPNVDVRHKLLTASLDMAEQAQGSQPTDDGKNLVELIRLELSR